MNNKSKHQEPLRIFLSHASDDISNAHKLERLLSNIQMYGFLVPKTLVQERTGNQY